MSCTEELKRPRGRSLSTTNLSSVTVKLCGTDHWEQWKLLRLEQWHPSLDPSLLFLLIGKHFFFLFSPLLTSQPLLHVSFLGGHFCLFQLQCCQLWVGVKFWNRWLHDSSFPFCFVFLSKCFHFLLYNFSNKISVISFKFIFKELSVFSRLLWIFWGNQNQVSVVTTCIRLCVITLCIWLECVCIAFAVLVIFPALGWLVLDETVVCFKHH